MHKLKILRRRVFGLPPWLVALAVYVLLLFGLVAVILLGSLSSSVLTLILIPVVLAAFVYSRPLTLVMIALGSLTAIWLALRISSDFIESIWTISLSTLAAVVLTESIRAVLRYRQRTEVELARERDFAESLLGAAPMMICVLDQEGRIVRMNRFAEETTGYALAEAQQLEWIRERVPQDVQEDLRSFLRKAFADPDSIEQGRVLPLLDRQGSSRDIRWYVQVIPELLEGRPGALALGEDVTDQRRAVRALRASEARYRTLVENLGEGIGIADVNETFVFANPAAERIFGVPPGSLVGMNVRDFTDAEEFTKVRKGTEARAQGISDRYELTIHRPDGDTRYLLLNAVPNVSKDGTFMGSLGMFLDITARREAQTALRHFNETLEVEVAARTAELRRERARLQAILNGVADGLVVIDAEGRITLANPVASRWLEEVLSPAGARTLRDVISSMPDRDASNRDVTLTVDGWDLRVQVAEIEPGLEDAAVADAAAVVSIHDVSDLKRVNRIKSRFIEDVSHELRTPTSAIKLYADMLSGASETRRPVYQAALSTEADRLAQLVEDILQINSIGSSAWQRRTRLWDLNEIVRQHEEVFRRRAAGRELDVDFELTDGSLMVRVDVDWLSDALSRLVDNAVLYTPAGGRIGIRVGSTVAEGRRWATLSVVDTGVGIAEEERTHVFERFYRGDYARDQQIPGTGLGLAIVQEIASLHGGRVTVESEVSKGSTFTIWTPMLNSGDDE